MGHGRRKGHAFVPVRGGNAGIERGGGAADVPGSEHRHGPILGERCDRLPIVILRADNADKRFLIDTAATSLLNEKSFPRGRNRAVRVQSWNETTTLNAREVSIGELSLGNHILLGVKLPAIDLSAIAKACGGQVEGGFEPR